MAIRNIVVVGDGSNTTVDEFHLNGVDCDKVYARVSANDEWTLVFEKRGVPSFATDTWAQIAEIAEQGNAAEYYAIGDEKSVTLNTGEIITLVILGFNHDDKVGGGKAGITVGMKECLATLRSMNDTGTSSYSWFNSSIRRNFLNGTFYNQSLPSDIKAVIKEVAKYASFPTTGDKLFLFSQTEIMGTNYSTTTQVQTLVDGVQYEYFKTAPIPTPLVTNDTYKSFTELNNTRTFYATLAVPRNFIDRFGRTVNTSRNRLYHYYGSKAQGNDGTTPISWWLRSQMSNSGQGIYCSLMNNLGIVGSDATTEQHGVAFGFCI